MPARTGSIPATGSTASVTFTINAPSSLTRKWIAQYQVTFTQSGIGTDFTGTALKIDGTAYTSSNLPTSLWLDQNSQHTIQSLSPLTGTTYKYTLSSTTGTSSVGTTTTQNRVTSITVTGSGTITGNYAKTKKQTPNKHSRIKQHTQTNTCVLPHTLTSTRSRKEANLAAHASEWQEVSPAIPCHRSIYISDP